MVESQFLSIGNWKWQRLNDGSYRLNVSEESKVNKNNRYPEADFGHFVSAKAYADENEELKG